MCICIYLFYIYTIYHVHNTIFECSCWSLLLLNISTLTRKYNGTYTYMFSSIPTCTPCTYPRMLTHTRKHAYTRMYAHKQGTHTVSNPSPPTTKPPNNVSIPAAVCPLKCSCLHRSALPCQNSWCSKIHPVHTHANTHTHTYNTQHKHKHRRITQTHTQHIDTVTEKDKHVDTDAETIVDIETGSSTGIPTNTESEGKRKCACVYLRL